MLVLLDRTFDVATLLRHTSTYNALVHDVLGMRLNRVTVAKGSSGGGGGGGGEESKTFDIDAKDSFWQQNAALPFPNVAENVDAALSAYKADMQQVTRNHASLQHVDDLGTAGSSLMTADELKVAISVLPELTERKRIIDSHLQMSTALLEQIKRRNLGNLFHLEQAIAEQSPAKIVEILRSAEGTPADKMRLFLVYYLTLDEVRREDLAVFETHLREAGCDLGALEYCKRIKSFQKMSSRAGQASTGTGAGSAAGAASKGGAPTDFLQSFGSKLTGGVLGNVLSSVKNLLPETADTPVTKFVEMAIEAATGAATGTASALRSTLGGGGTPKEELFTAFDPKVPLRPARGGGASGAATTPSAPQRSAYNHLMVFVVGGSNYTEFNHVEEWMRKRPQLKMNLTFGTTELLTGEEFLHQLSKLHRP